jgi:hypothetical protein
VIVAENEQDVSGARKQRASQKEEGSPKTVGSWSCHGESNACPIRQVTPEVLLQASFARTAFLTFSAEFPLLK